MHLVCVYMCVCVCMYMCVLHCQLAFDSPHTQHITNIACTHAIDALHSLTLTDKSSQHDTVHTCVEVTMQCQSHICVACVVHGRDMFSACMLVCVRIYVVDLLRDSYRVVCRSAVAELVHADVPGARHEPLGHCTGHHRQGRILIRTVRNTTKHLHYTSSSHHHTHA